MSYRKLKFDNQIWRYIVGSKGVKICSPQNKVVWVQAWKILKHENENQYIKHVIDVSGDTDHGYSKPITPQIVKDYIVNLLS